LKALKKLEQNPNGENPAIDLWQRETVQAKASGRGTRSLRLRPIVLFVLFVPLLAIGGWLLLKYALLPADKSQAGKPLPKSVEAIAINMPAGAASVPEKTDLGIKANSPLPTNAQRGRAATGKAAVTTRTGARVPEKKEEKPPAGVNRTQAKTPLKAPAKKLRVDPRSLQTGSVPIRASDSSLTRSEPVLNEDNKSYPPPVRSYPPRNVGKPAVDERSVLTGFSVQAIAWSKIPAERIAVINGLVVREGGFVEGIQVTQIDMEEVSLRKGDQTWQLQCGR